MTSWGLGMHHSEYGKSIWLGLLELTLQRSVLYIASVFDTVKHGGVQAHAAQQA